MRSHLTMRAIKRTKTEAEVAKNNSAIIQSLNMAHQFDQCAYSVSVYLKSVKEITTLFYFTVSEHIILSRG